MLLLIELQVILEQLKLNLFFIKDHPFSNNQEVILTVPNSHSKIEVSSSTFGSTFNIPSSGSSQTVFISNKQKILLE